MVDVLKKTNIAENFIGKETGPLQAIWEKAW